MKFDVISIVLIVIIIGFVLFGIFRGFFKTLISFLKNILSGIIAALLSKPLASLLVKTSFGVQFGNNFTEYFEGKGGIFITTITEANKADVIESALVQMNIPEMLHGFLNKLLCNIIPNTGADVTVAEALGPTIAFYIFIGISFIICFVLLIILFSILGKFLDKLANIPFVGLFNRLLGGILNGLLGFLFACLIVYVIALIVPQGNTLSNWLTETMYLQNDDVFTISKFFYEHNFLVKIITFFQQLFIK